MKRIVLLSFLFSPNIIMSSMIKSVDNNTDMSSKYIFRTGYTLSNFTRDTLIVRYIIPANSLPAGEISDHFYHKFQGEKHNLIIGGDPYIYEFIKYVAKKESLALPQSAWFASFDESYRCNNRRFYIDDEAKTIAVVTPTDEVDYKIYKESRK